MSYNNIFSLGELFEQVQLQQIYKDGKTFVDCTPKKDLSFIHQQYEQEKNNKDFDLSFFVHTYFTEPKDPSANYTSGGEPIATHITELWDVLTRKPVAGNDSLITLPHPYIVPGGRFREIYYWDSYFTMLGLQISGKVDMIQNMVNNFSYLIDAIGYTPNGNRTYYLGRSQPPFFACMVQLLAEEKGNSILIQYLPQLEKEYNFWMKGRDNLSKENTSLFHSVLLPDGNILNRYYDENNTARPEAFKEDTEGAERAQDKAAAHRHLRAAAESGWDFSSRWFKDGKDFSTIHTADIIPVDLNCLLYNLEQIIAKAYTLQNDTKNVDHYLMLSYKRKDAIQKYCWNIEQHFYFDYDFVSASQKRSLTLSAAFPLFFSIADKEQAESVAAIIENTFLFDGGLVTTTETTSQQWDAPNGWAPLQWIAVKGLLNYGYKNLAEKIAKRWMNINEKVYQNTGKLMEKYNVVSTDLTAGGGEYEAQDGFGWTNGVYLAMQKLF